MEKNEEAPIIKEKFSVIGIVTNAAFQRCRFLSIKLHRSFPDQYEKPVIKPMLNVEWEEFLTKMKRTYGNGVWALKRPMMVLLNDQYLGDVKTFVNHIIKKFRFSLNLNLEAIGENHLVEMLRDIMGKYRQIAYLTIAINHQVIGTMMFELYNELVPLACENFLEKCKNNQEGYTGTPVHRIVKGSWIQCGGWNLKNKIMPCENYIIPHDRRGVLCTTNVGRHKENTKQFFITLAPAPWMDARYVAFGQLLQGEEVLKAIERVPTYYESPKYPIDIVMSGEVTLDGIPDFNTSMERPEFQNILPSIMFDDSYPKADYAIIPKTSVFSMTKFRKGFYSMETDLKNYLAFSNLPDYLMTGAGRTGSEKTSSATLDAHKISEDKRYSLKSIDKSIINFTKNQEIFKDCTMPTYSATTL